jgi:hypothetical protein
MHRRFYLVSFCPAEESVKKLLRGCWNGLEGIEYLNEVRVWILDAKQ